ncbi:MAG: hypothetical protein G01um101420_430 [Parcubacteria group bacterium Gr01-1014_20]|nr:MAG: hypothetical protein G01um101420_430 [Parcubacteria group bacterium Gr01-1014_20]
MEGQETVPEPTESKTSKNEVPATGRDPIKTYWTPLSLQAINSPDRFVRIVNDLINGIRAIIPSFPRSKKNKPR